MNFTSSAIEMSIPDGIQTRLNVCLLESNGICTPWMEFKVVYKLINDHAIACMQPSYKCNSVESFEFLLILCI